MKLLIYAAFSASEGTIAPFEKFAVVDTGPGEVLGFFNDYTRATEYAALKSIEEESREVLARA